MPETTARRFDVRHLPGFTLMAIAAFTLLYVPLLILVVYSFNSGDTVAAFEGFSLRWYRAAAANEAVQEAALRSFLVAIVAATVATLFATMAALATTRGTFRGATFAYAVINQPLMAPDIVTGVSLLVFFALIKIATGYSGMGYILIAHIAFCIPFAYLPIRGRLTDMDRTLETAAADLYATPWRTFRLVTLPLLWPGILAGFMLAFVISLDEVVITNLISGPGQTTMPVFLIGQFRRSVSQEINAVATIFLAISVVLVSVFFLLNRSRTS